jgi:hypothetical protein
MSTRERECWISTKAALADVTPDASLATELDEREASEGGRSARPSLSQSSEKEQRALGLLLLAEGGGAQPTRRHGRGA